MVAAAPLERQSAAPRQLVVRAHRDNRTGAWWADSDDVPGLVTEAPSYDELVDRVIAVVPELCKANSVSIANGDEIQIRPEKGGSEMTREELDRELSKLGERIWNALSNDNETFDLLHELTEAKLALDGAERSDSELTQSAAVAIFEGCDPDNPKIVRPKAFVASREWAKNSLYNLSSYWVLNQAMARMTVEQRAPSDVAKNDP